MQPLECIHRPNKVLKQCSFPVNRGGGGGDVHDRHWNRVFSNGINIHSIGRCGMCGFLNRLPLKVDQHFKRRGEHSNYEDQGKK